MLFCRPRDGCQVKAQLLFGWVFGVGVAWQHSALASCSGTVLERSEALGILEHCVCSGSAAAASQGGQGVNVIRHWWHQGDNSPSQLGQSGVRMEGVVRALLEVC